MIYCWYIIIYTNYYYLGLIMKRKPKNISMLPEMIDKLERLSLKSGFTLGQITEMAIGSLSEEKVCKKAQELYKR